MRPPCAGPIGTALCFASALSVAACSDAPVQPSSNHGVTPVASLVAGRPYRVIDLSPMQWAVAINASGQVAGTCETGSCLWHDGTVTYLGDMVVTVSFHFTDVLNDAGQVIGTCPTNQANVYHACLWDRGTLTDIDAASEVGNSYPNAINPAGQVVGMGSDGHAFLWSDGVMTDLGTLGGTESEARAINPGGQVVGWSTTTAGARHAVLWRNGVPTDLDPLGQYEETDAYQINPAGTIVGTARLGGEDHVFLWKHGTLTDLGEGSYGDLDRPVEINPRGQVVGFLDFARGGWIWERGVRTLLEGLEPGAITPAGRVVGIDWAAEPFARAFVWERGVQIELPVLGTGAGESWALAINPAGQVIGHDWTSDAAVMWVREE